MSLKNIKINKLENITKDMVKLQISKKQSLLNFFENIQNNKKSIYYIKNNSDNGIVNNNNYHEKMVKNAFINLGFVKSDKKINITRKELDKKINKPDEILLKSGEFIEQPFGSQNNPDFLIKLNKKSVIAIECKSSKDGKPQYNSGGITPYFIYIFSSKNMNDTTFYMGSSIQSTEVYNEIKKIKLELKKIVILYNQKLKELDKKNRGIIYYSRTMICQKGDRSITNYFEHEDRELCENKVIEFLKDQ